ncbi:kinase-like domain-containing protein [Colletotrichum phormii]|uniref:Kinase-like domain-containing protein n=1 Tax=Colletotrichum phormii TaxID=359342 RepID=A0AAI9ZI33_9PEZI|nr:kinase-like domain-containing protein [Colletotrichum phormii]KAK1624881.1 kinase-like domain-containing protein [Colletotrichum phormii]
MNIDLVRWVARQTAGMAAGLARIHEYPGKVDGNMENAVKYGRHGDIKPENILWFRSSEEDLGRLVISDFGLGVFNSKRSRSNIPNDSGIGRTPTYRPPECDIEGAMISRSWDIWTLGCVYVEFVTWLLGGWELSEHFAEWRMTTSSICGQDFKSDIYFDIVEVRVPKDDDTSSRSMGAMVKPAVTRWFDGLHNDRGCSQYTHDILRLVQDKMLIVESAVRKRATCKEVYEELRRIQRRCVESKGYCVKPVPFPLPAASGETPAVKIRLNDNALDTIKRNHPRLRTHQGRTEEPPKARGGYGDKLLAPTKVALY